MAFPRRSPLHDAHVAAGARLVLFGGWEMPLSYPTGTVVEHLACRRSAACFDVSHLGTVRVEGPDAWDRLQRSLSNDLRRIAPGHAQYSHLLGDDGSVVDDVIVWWTADDSFDVMPNASNTVPVRQALGGDDITAGRAVIAVQGPEARSLLGGVAPDLAAVPRFGVRQAMWQRVPVTVAGTGYTGEDGVEIAVPAEAAGSLWSAVVGAGVVPAGLGARDTLRLEAGLPLYGHELGPGITPVQAGLSWVVGWDKPELRGRDVLVAERRDGPRRRLRGIVAGRRPLRDGAAVSAGGVTIGHCTSGSFSPVLGRGIALAYLDSSGDAGAGAGTFGVPVVVDLRGTPVDATTVPLPFVAGSPAR